MIVHKYVKRGLNHANYCEDFILHETVGEKYELFGVFDGCSSGKDSHFASSFIAKVIRSEFLNMDVKNGEIPKKLQKKLLYRSVQKIKELKSKLLLDIDDLLSTIILFIYDKMNDCGHIVVVGDGFVSINGQQNSIDQNNMPDYLAYHLDKINDEDKFLNWYKQHTKVFSVDKLLDVSISTDGVESFVKKNVSVESEAVLDPGNYLLSDDFLIINKAMLGRKCNILERKYGLVNGDDLGIIRVVKKNE
ncbi:MAG: protein phosphatase 2C domain-containing protein [Bacteroidota bacterium]